MNRRISHTKDHDGSHIKRFSTSSAPAFVPPAADSGACHSPERPPKGAGKWNEHPVNMPGTFAVAAVHKQLALVAKGSLEKLPSATLRGTVAAPVAHTPHKQVAVEVLGKESSGQQCLVTLRCKTVAAAAAAHTTDKEVAAK